MYWTLFPHLFPTSSRFLLERTKQWSERFVFLAAPRDSFFFSCLTPFHFRGCFPDLREVNWSTCLISRSPSAILPFPLCWPPQLKLRNFRRPLSLSFPRSLPPFEEPPIRNIVPHPLRGTLLPFLPRVSLFWRFSLPVLRDTMRRRTSFALPSSALYSSSRVGHPTIKIGSLRPPSAWTS